MRILYITNNTSMNGGANKSLIDMCLGQIKEGNTVAVVSPSGDAFETRLKEIGLKHYIISDMSLGVTSSIVKGFREFIRNVGKRVILPMVLPKRVRAVCRIAKEFHADIIHTNTSCSIEGVLAAKKLGLRHVWHIREMMEEDYQLRYTLPRAHMKTLFEQSDQVICISRAILEKFSWFIGDTRCQVLYNAVTLPKPDITLNGELAEKGGRFRFLIVGGVIPAKGILDAVTAFCRQFGSNDRAELYIVGSYEPEDAYYNQIMGIVRTNQAEERVIFCGTTKNVTNYIVNSDCGLMCSYAEGLGRVTIEYMMCGLPVIGAAAGGTLEIVDEDRGLFYSPGDIEALAGRMKQLYDDRRLCARLGRNGLEYANREFSPELYSKKLNKIYLELF